MAGVIAPNTAGFFAAAKRLRADFGSDGIFHLPVAATWPIGTKINPDTGRPYDATVVRTSATYTDLTKTVLVILKEGSPLRPQADAHWAQAGLLSGMDIIIDLDADDYADVQSATEMTVGDRRYRIEEWKPFRLANVTYRYLVYGMER